MRNKILILMLIIFVRSLSADDSVQVNNVSPTIILLPEVARLSNCLPVGVIDIQNIGNSQDVSQIFRKMILKEKWPQSFVIKPLKNDGKVKCSFFYQNGRSENFEFSLTRLVKSPIMKIGSKEVVSEPRAIDDFGIFREIIKDGSVEGFHDVSTQKISSKLINGEKYKYRILKILTDFSSSRIFVFEVDKSVRDIELSIRPESVNKIRSSIVVKGEKTSLLIVAANFTTGAKEVLGALL